MYLSGDDTVSFTQVPPTVYVASKLGLQLAEGVSYYVTVVAFNRIGMYTTATTDGIVIDREIPLTGAALDGDQRHDLQYQSNTSVLSAQWHGFFDRHSFIEYYNYTITILQPHPSDWNIDGPGNVGLKLFVSVNGLSLRSGVRYHANVRATDAAGLHSEIAVSDGVTVDSSPPVFVSCQQFGENLLTDKTMQNATSMNEIVSGWNVDVGRISINTSETRQQLLLSGIISRKIAFTKDVIYQLDIRARAVGNTHTQHMAVTAPGMHRVVALAPDRKLVNRCICALYCRSKIVSKLDCTFAVIDSKSYRMSPNKASSPCHQSVLFLI